MISSVTRLVTFYKVSAKRAGAKYHGIGKLFAIYRLEHSCVLLLFAQNKLVAFENEIKIVHYGSKDYLLLLYYALCSIFAVEAQTV